MFSPEIHFWGFAMVSEPVPGVGIPRVPAPGDGEVPLSLQEGSEPDTNGRLDATLDEFPANEFAG